MKIPNKRELQHITLNHLSDTDFKDFIKIDKLQNHILFGLIIQLYHRIIL